MTARTQPAPWLRPVTTGVPALARDIVDAVLSEIPEYRAACTTLIRAEAIRLVREGLYTVLSRLASPPVLRLADSSTPLTQKFRELGRREALAGRSHDTLQAAYRIASRVLVRRLLDWEREFPIPVNRAADLASTAFQFISDLAEQSAQGHLEVLGAGPSLDRERARLLSALLDSRLDTSQVLLARAEGVQWPVPETATLLSLLDLPDGGQDAALAPVVRTVLGPDALAGRFAGQDLVIVPGAPTAAELTERFTPALPDVTVLVGFPSPVAQLGFALRWVSELARLVKQGVAAGSTVITCEANALNLVEDAAGDVYDWMVHARLAPLFGLTPPKRLKLGRLLSAWLELGGTNGDAPGVLDKHRQTLRYQRKHLERLFGDQLTDRTKRLELTLALRRALPVWELEVAH